MRSLWRASSIPPTVNKNPWIRFEAEQASHSVFTFANTLTLVFLMGGGTPAVNCLV